jgi:ATP-dependent Clp protease adaptor protein ClpS
MMRSGQTKEQSKPLIDTDVMVDEEEPFHLIVWNDEVNTFEWVIETLVEVCQHSYEQAEQCAYIIHFQGKYAVKQGSYDELKPMCNSITERGIGATVEAMVS